MAMLRYLKPTLIKEFAAAMRRWAKSGFETVDRDVYLKRRYECYKCTKGSRTCPRCGCNINFKTFLATEKCPDERW